MNGKVQVLTYENPYTFHEQPEFKPYADCIHICANRSLTVGVRKLFQGAKTLAVGDVANYFYPGWNNTDNRFLQYTQLSDILRDWQEDSKVITSFRRNKLDVLITMRNLTEIGLVPNHIRPYVSKEEERVFCDLWEAMMPNFQAYMENAQEQVASNESILQVFADIRMPLTNKTVVLHGFYYISPLQHYLFTQWNKQGINLVFLSLYNERYPSVFSFLEENFSSVYGWVDRDAWTITSESGNERSKAFAAAFEGEEPAAYSETIKEKAYDYMNQFAADIDGRDVYVSPNDEELEKRIREYYPDSYENNRHFLSYPLGQYLLHLHGMWSEERGAYVVTENMLMEAFASGWLQLDGENARDYLSSLHNILPYFTGCTTADEWLERIRQLYTVKRTSSIIAHKYKLTPSDTLKAVRVNPVLRFSFFSVRPAKVKKIEQFISKLVNDAKWLINIEENRVTIRTHFNRIMTLLEESNVKSSFIGAEEEQLLQQLEQMLTAPRLADMDFHVSDLADAIMVYLKTGLEDKEEETEASALRKSISFNRMNQLDGLILLNKEKEIHLCGMDEMHFPASSSPMPWPLSIDLLMKLDNKATEMYLFRNRHQKDFAKYLFYTALSYQGSIKVSWIRNWGGQESLDKAIYVQLLQSNEMESGLDEPYSYVPDKEQPVEDGLRERVQKCIEQFPQEEAVEMSLCKRRFFYSTVVAPYASYSSPFHHEFLIGNLVKLFAVGGKTKEEIVDLMSDMFPYLSMVRLRLLVDDNMNPHYVQGMRKYGLERRLQYGGLEYPMSSTYFQFLTHHGAFQNEKWKSSFELMTSQKKKRQSLIHQFAYKDGVLPEANPSELCKLCPHAEYCEEALYSVDITKRGFDDIEPTIN